MESPFLFFFVLHSMPLVKQTCLHTTLTPCPLQRGFGCIYQIHGIRSSPCYTFLFYTTACNFSTKESLFCTQEGSLPAFLGLKGNINMIILKIFNCAVYVRTIVTTLTLGMGFDMEDKDYQWVSHHYFYRITYILFNHL